MGKLGTVGRLVGELVVARSFGVFCSTGFCWTAFEMTFAVWANKGTVVGFGRCFAFTTAPGTAPVAEGEGDVRGEGVLNDSTVTSTEASSSPLPSAYAAC